MYLVTTYEVKSGLFGTNTMKADNSMTQYLNMQEKNGWILVSMTESNTSGKNFVYKMVFRKA